MPKLFKLKTIAALFFAFGLLGCESTRHYNRTNVTTMSTPLPKKPYGSVQLIQSKEEIQKPYTVIAIMSVEGSAGEEAQFIKAFLYRAADLGADAVIMERVGLSAGLSGGGWVVGRSGGFGKGFDTSHTAVYKGEAIAFK